MVPNPEQILQARKDAGLSQPAAAALIYSKKRTWQDWELGVTPMHPGLWELFRIKSALIARDSINQTASR
jgi:DNA-binding transcriptional regulator YiaG